MEGQSDFDHTTAADVPRPATAALATLESPLAAALLDGLITLPFVIAKVKLMHFLGHVEKSKAETMAITFLIILPLWAYQWYLVAKTGQTLGKRWMKIKIVKLDGSPVGLVSGVALRSWVPIGINILLTLVGAPDHGVVSLADHLAIFGKSSRCLHDWLAGTKVIKASDMFHT